MTPAHSPRRAMPADFLSVGADTPPEIVSALEEYFRRFAAPVSNSDGCSVCVGCGKPVDGLMATLSPGSHAAYVWGLAHGEASCSSCGYPARGMHYVKDPADGSEILSVRNLFLPYHPDELVRPEEETPDDG